MGSAFGAKETAYLGGQVLGRLATIGSSGVPHVVPVMFRFETDSETISIGAHVLPGRGQRRVYHRNIERNPWVSFVVDDLASTDPWTPRGVQIRGRAAIHHQGGERLAEGSGPLWVSIAPARITSWGIETSPFDPPLSREVSVASPAR